jgi:hypothetical protein
MVSDHTPPRAPTCRRSLRTIVLTYQQWTGDEDNDMQCEVQNASYRA